MQNTSGMSGSGNGRQNGNKNNVDTIDLEDSAGTSDVDLDLSDVNNKGKVSAQIDTNGDGTVDETVKFGLANNEDVTVIGTDGDNTFVGDATDNTFVGSAGDDAIIGGDGTDTVDYSDLEAAITISSAGVLDKGELGSDTLGTFDVAAGTIEVVETVVGNPDETNVVDATSVQGAVAIDVNLASGDFTGNIVENAGDFAPGDLFAVTLTNFMDVLGTDNDDQITGDGQANLLTGAAGTDTISGAGGADSISGGTGDDVLTGGAGADTFTFAQGDGDDTITDFNIGVDVLDFEGVSTGDITTDAGQTDTTLKYEDSSIVLEGVVADDVTDLLLIA